MVRISLDACIPDLESPANIYQDEERKRLLIRKGLPLTEKSKQLLLSHNVRFIDFPLPFEEDTPPPYTFSEDIEAALFRLAQQTFVAFKENSISDPLEIRKKAYDIFTEAAKEFQSHIAQENPVGTLNPKRQLASIVHLRTIGAIEDYLYEHAKNVSLLCLVLGFDYFKEVKQLLPELHKVAIAGLFADIGMMRISKRILSKEKLENEDWLKIKIHPEVSALFVESLYRQKDFVSIKAVLQHHERLDRSGYPKGLAPCDQTPYTFILAVADSYCSMVNKRYFRSAKNPLDALISLNESAETCYDKKAIRCLNYRIAPYPIGTVANFAGQQLIQVVDLKNISIGMDNVPIYSLSKKQEILNLPHHVKTFDPKPGEASLYTAIPIDNHLDKMGIPLDCFDLLKTYGFVNQTDEKK